MKQLYTQAQHANSNRHDSFLGSAATVQPLGGARRSARVPSLFPVRNKGKGPPGLTSPPPASGLVPAAAFAGGEKSYASFKKNNTIHNQLTNIKSLSIMKKQILILVVIVLAAFANVNKSYGQCDGPLSPIAGKPYDYSVEVNPGGGTFDWYVTTDATDLIGGARIASGTGVLIGGTGYNTPGSTAATVNITWTAQAIAAALSGTKYFLVVKYTTSCSNNIKPWLIKPINLFQIFVENVDAAGAVLASTDICRAEVASASVDASDRVVYDYGENVFYLKVTANFFTGSWTPKIDMAALSGSLTAPQSVTSIAWSLTTTFPASSNFDLTTGVATAAVPDKDADNITTGTDEYIYIKVVIDHGKFEGIADQTIALNISATDAANNPDRDPDPVDCTKNLAVDPDHVKQVLKARPSLTNESPANFLPAQP